jgi:quinohemoprotein amine dehydrogenase
MLAQKYAYDGEAWRKWRKAKKPDLSGTWVVQGHQPTKGDVEGTMYAAPLGGDTFEVDWDATYLDSAPRGVAATATEGDAPEAVEKLDGQGRAVVYTGYEWRATLELGGKKWQQVLAADPDGQALRGRVYEAEHPELGIQVVLTRSGSKYAPVDAPTDRITVEPPYQVARVGDGGGPVPKEYAAFDAVAWNNGPDGKPGTADDVRIGAVPAAWRAEPWDEQARAERDAEFAGKFEDPSVGLFTPGDAGPNPARKYGTNNAGNLKVVATVKDGERELTGEAHLIVTVQRWIHSPIP